MIHSVVLVPSIQQSDSVTYVYFSSYSFPSWSLLCCCSGFLHGQELLPKWSHQCEQSLSLSISIIWFLLRGDQNILLAVCQFPSPCSRSPGSSSGSPVHFQHYRGPELGGRKQLSQYLASLNVSPLITCQHQGAGLSAFSLYSPILWMKS